MFVIGRGILGNSSIASDLHVCQTFISFVTIIIVTVRVIVITKFFSLTILNGILLTIFVSIMTVFAGSRFYSAFGLIGSGETLTRPLVLLTGAICVFLGQLPFVIDFFIRQFVNPEPNIKIMQEKHQTGCY